MRVPMPRTWAAMKIHMKNILLEIRHRLRDPIRDTSIDFRRVTVPPRVARGRVQGSAVLDIRESSRSRGFIFVMAPIYPLMTAEGTTDTASRGSYDVSRGQLVIVRATLWLLIRGRHPWECSEGDIV